MTVSKLIEELSWMPGKLEVVINLDNIRGNINMAPVTPKEIKIGDTDDGNGTQVIIQI